MHQPTQLDLLEKLREQLDRIERRQQEIFKGLKLQQQLDRIESGMEEIAAMQLGMTPEEEAAAVERLKVIRDRLKGIGKESA